jgi:UDP:flavonoid glycosyltransferase YjiC (YdhE family)
MRVLFTTQPGIGYLHPLVPLATAVAEAGHAVRFATARPFCPTVEAAGFECVPVGLDWTVTDMERSFPAMLDEPAGRARYEWVTRNVLRGTAAGSTPDLLRLAGEWRPDVIVRDAAEFGGCLAAELLGIPHAASGALWFHPPGWQEHVGERLTELRDALGLPPDPAFEMPFRYLALTFRPPQFVERGSEVPNVTHFLRPGPYDRANPGLQPELLQALAGPLVHASLGAARGERAQLYARMFEAVREEPLTLIASIGDDADPKQFGPLPSNVLLVPFVPHSALFPHCQLVITNGGLGTILAAIDHGLPLILMPSWADETENASRCEALGVGTVLNPTDYSGQEFRNAIQLVGNDPRYRASARRLAEEFQRLPDLRFGVSLLERLAEERRPILPAVDQYRTQQGWPSASL